jgi:hypothetical protein
LIFRDREPWFFVLVAVIFVGALIIGGIQLRDAIECGNKGGVYVTAKGMWPVCLKVDTL